MKRLTWLLVMAVVTLPVQAQVPEPQGAWEFDGPDPLRATIGASLELVGSAESIMGLSAADGAVRIGEDSYFICTHGIAPNGGGEKVNEWTLLIDFSYPASSMSDPPSGYNDLFQTDPTNADDADWTINSSGAIGIGAVGYSSAHGYTTGPDTWYRLVVVVDNGVRHDVYVDGVEIFQGNQQGVDGRFSLAETLLLFCAGYNLDGDDAPIDVSTVAIWDAPLTADEIAAMGWAGDTFFRRKEASNPAPADGADDVLISEDLGWTAGEYAATHNVYFGPSLDDVSAAASTALIAEDLAADVDTLDVGLMDYGQTYYWRVDEVNAAPDNTVFEGTVWSFTTEPFAYAIENVTVSSNGIADSGSGPENTINGSGLNGNDEHSANSTDAWLAVSDGTPLWLQYEFDHVYKLYEMWVWNCNTQFETLLGFGLKDVTVEYSLDGIDWTLLGQVEFAQAPATEVYLANTKVDFAGVPAQYVRLTVDSAWVSTSKVGLSEVRFLTIPTFARKPQPADGQTGVAQDAVLSWRAGREAVSHEVYLSTDQQAVPDRAAPADSVGTNSFTPADLQLGTTYYWKVDEVNEAEATPLWEGALWSFSVQEFATIDDFEGYDNDENVIYETWVDGWINETGSTVGYWDAPFAETSIVNGGKQSLPFEYVNSDSPYYSEIEYDLGGADWTGGGADTLRLYVYGAADNDPGTLYVALEDSAGNAAAVSYADQAVLTTESWQEWTIALDAFSGVNLSAVQTLYIGVGDRDNPASGGSGLILIDDVAYGHPVASN